jgi:putative endonuclease
MSYFVYILASRKHGTLYVGVTNNIARRVSEHRAGSASAFTKKYQVHRLVYAESHDNVEEAIKREKAIKEWQRAWKVQLIERANPEWDDLAESLNR